MKLLYFDCSMGAAGDMLTAALLDLTDNPEHYIERLNSLGLPNVHVSLEKSVKCGIAGKRVVVTVAGEEEGAGHKGHGHHRHESSGHECSGHEHRSLADMEKIILGLNLPASAGRKAAAVYRLLARAEAHVHGTAPGEVHFHEVGALDAIVDIAGVCLLMEELAPRRVVVSPVHVGSGHVHCAHGVLPVPAPATAFLLQGMPVYGGSVEGELCTPTGAALLKFFADSFGPLPAARFIRTGYGMGRKNFSQANCVRAFLGEGEESADGEDREAGGPRRETVCELSCNLDDMTPEAAAFAQELLLAEGALDVYTVPLGMKKGRRGQMLCCLCRQNNSFRMANLILRHTSTLGVREKQYSRYVLDREIREAATRFGTVRVKTAFYRGGVKHKAEYEDAARIARQQNVPLAEVLSEVERVLSEEQRQGYGRCPGSSG